MRKEIRWLHLSDFHFGKKSHDYDQEFSSKKLIEHVGSQKEKGILPDLIFITGDIANSGRQVEYEKFYVNVYAKLKELLGEDVSSRIFLVPGNHDLDREVNSGFSKEKFLRPDSADFHPTEESFKKRKMLADRFESYVYHAGHENSLNFLDKHGTYIDEITVDGTLVAIVGINTAWLCDGENDQGNLTPGLQIVRDALASIDKKAIKFVLGHHPLGWLHEDVLQPLEVIFGDHNVIYLHGHMHKSWAIPNLSPGGDFITIQSGAAWQAPEGSKWKNGFLWGVLDNDRKHIDLQPFTWSSSNQCWVLSGDTFHENNRVGDVWRFLAPGQIKKIDYTQKAKTEPLVGWTVKNLDDLEKCTAPLKRDEALRYFDGATPTWETVLSDSIPRREIVAKLVAQFSPLADDPPVCVLVGAGCEGKTTALLQACLEILRKDDAKKALIRTNHTRPFKAAELLPTLRAHGSWVIVVDEADQSAKELLRFIDSGFDGYEGKVSFLLASRDSDWISSGANTLAWDYTAKYKEVSLKDLSSRDADAIVGAWARYGTEGLGAELSALDESRRADKLKYYAKKEAKGNYGAFFGALLVARHGNDLLEHAERMLERLGDHQLGEDQTLMDALGYIAAMHSEGFDKLSFPALANVLQLPIPKMMSSVIRPLGREAAAATTSSFIFTRHKYIADAIIEVLENRFGKDISSYFIDLAISEQDRYRSEQVLNLNFWLFDLSEGLFKAGKTGLAIALANRLYENDEGNFHLLTKLASLYRREGNASEAVRLFREFSAYPSHRGFYFEWGVCEGRERNYLENAWLIAHAMSDDVEKAAISVDQCYKMLNALSQCYNQLYNRYVDPVFEQASHAANSLLVIFEDRVSVGDRSGNVTSDFLRLVGKKRATLFRRGDAIKKIKEASSCLSRYGICNEVSSVVSITLSEYKGVDRLAENVEAQRSQQ